MVSPQELLVSIIVLGGVAMVFGILISVVNANFKVWEDPRVDGVRELLPGNDCGACGQAGCRAFAEAVVKGLEVPATCTVASPDAKDTVSYTH